MFKKKRIWLVMALLALTLVLYGCTQLWDLAGYKSADEQEGLQPLSATSDQFEVVNGKVRVFIGFTQRPGPPQEAMVRGLGGEIRYTYHLIPAIAATIPGKAIDALQRNPNVTRIEPVIKVYAIDAELDNAWGVKRIGAGTVHDAGNRGAGVKVAIIDSGIDYTHPDLDANYVSGYDFVNDDDDPMDDAGHGTHVAGTVAAEDNGEGVVGVAPAASLYALKVLDASGSGDYSDVIAALQWVVDHGLQVTNNSYGSSGDPGTLVKEAFDNAYAAGVLSVCAAGNSGNPPGRGDNVIYPARYESCIAVAATDQSDKRARWSSTGLDVELSAPGVNINSTLPGGGYGGMSGTSMASPHVAGTAALVITAGITGNDAVRQQLVDTADDLGDPGLDTKYGYGLVDADEAAGTPPPPVTDIAITEVSVPSSVLQGDVVSVDVVVKNVGNQDVGSNINVTLTDDTDLVTISTQTISGGLAVGAFTTLIYSWDTGSASIGDHILTASHDFVDDNASNDFNSGTVAVNEPAGELIVTSIEPNNMQAATTIGVTISGSGFVDGAEVTFENGAGPAPTASNIAVKDASTITATVTAKSGGPPRNRKWDVRVTNPDDSSGVLVGGFTVVP